MKQRICSFVKAAKITPSMLPKSVKIVEVSPRDGLQNQKQIVPTSTKVQLIQKLSNCKIQTVEATSFVSPKWVPQMADNSEVYKLVMQMKKQKSLSTSFPALVPNMKGLQSAKLCKVQQIAVFGAASETFSQKNINCSIQESLKRFQPVIKEALSLGIKVRGYISCVMGCPYEGQIDPIKVNEVAVALKEMGCYQISLGDTIGIGTPEKTQKLLKSIEIDKKNLAAHFHNTYDRALQNLHGIQVIDSSVSGIGGCPYAKGASGNVSTQDVLGLLKVLGIQTDIDAECVFQTGEWICSEMERKNCSLVKKYSDYKDLSKIQF